MRAFVEAGACMAGRMVREAMRQMKRLTTAVALVLTCGLDGRATAEGAWTTDVTVYGWFTGIEGDISAPAFGLGTSGTLSPRDVLDNLEGAFFAKVETWNGDFGLVFDLVSADLGFDLFTPVPAPAAVRAETSLALATIAAGWRVLSTDSDEVDLFGGLRYVSFKAAAAAGPPLSVGGDVSEDWLDPLFGIKAIHQVTPRFGIQGVVDLGGFGVGSDLTINAYAGGRYALNDRLTAEFGLRYISIDYSTERLDTKTDFWGPAIGLTYRF